VAGPIFASEAWDISADGQTVVGTAAGQGAFWEPFRWTSSGGMRSLGFTGFGYGVSADGNTVVGMAGYGFRWTVPGRLESPIGTQAFRVSADGGTVVGRAGSYASRWTQAGGLQTIVPDAAWGVSPDGNLVVGRHDLYTHYEAFRWSATGGVLDLGVLPGSGNFSEAHDTSADGSVVVGESGQAFIWTPAMGMRPLRDVLAEDGLDLTGWTLTTAWGVSDDGTIITGSGINPDGQTEAWIATIPEPSPCALVAIAGCLCLARRPCSRRVRKHLFS